MSHPNPYLFQINRMVLQACSRMDISASARSYPLQDVMDYTDAFTMFRRVVLFYRCTNAYCCIKYSFECNQVVNFNVSSTKDNAHIFTESAVEYS